MIANYAKGSIIDIVLCTLMTAAISSTVFSGFYVNEAQAKAYGLTLILSLMLNLCLAAVSYNRRTIIFGGTALLVAAGAAVAVGSSISGGNVFRDKEDNMALFYVLLILCGVIIYLLSRTRLGNIIILGTGILTGCLISYMYETHQYVAFLIFICTCIVMQIYRNYIHNAIHSETVRVNRASAVVSAAALMTIVVGVSALIFLLVIQPLDPPHKEIKLITKYKSLQVLEKVGVATTSQVMDPDKGSNKENNEEKDAKQEGTDKSNGSSSSDQKNKLNRNNNDKVHAIRYRTPIPTVVLVLLLIILAAVMAVLIKKQLRKRWLAGVLAKDRKTQVKLLYGFFLKKNKQLKIAKDPNETPYEYAERAQPYLEFFDLEGFDSADISDAYVRVAYGDEEPSEEILEKFITYYEVWYMKCRLYMGNLKYVLKYFIL